MLDRLYMDCDPNVYDIEYLPFDVKNMFTDIDKAYVRQAAQYFLLESPPSWVTHVYIHRFSKKLFVTAAPPSRASHQYAYISLKDLLAFITFDLDQSWFLVGETVVFQILSIPIGSYLSATLAICLCTYAEHKCYHSLLASNVISPPMVCIEGIRIMDDGVLMTAIHKALRGVYPYTHAELRTLTLANLYPSSMTLEFDPPTPIFPLLECYCIDIKARLYVRHRNKNFLSLVSTGSPTVITARPSSS